MTKRFARVMPAPDTGAGSTDPKDPEKDDPVKDNPDENPKDDPDKDEEEHIPLPGVGPIGPLPKPKK